MVGDSIAIADSGVPGHCARPELHQLAVFLQVVEQRSFTGAARRLGCSQPAVSQTIRRLEDIYGGDLFARWRGAPLALTPIGKAVLPGVRLILYAVDRQMADATSTAQSGGGTLSVGFCPGLFGGRFRTGMATFATEAPLVRLRLVEDAPDAHLIGIGSI
ncbi:LysR family transcriptional regulator [Hephaestia caeni]|uniref:LysR family transcriptional regulator n=1 Tax=Hephaestia caeni TaxID=645617 RepID=UPI000E5C1A0B|nr:LysR family transcriptional regulator [Hephaestia caeni]